MFFLRRQCPPVGTVKNTPSEAPGLSGGVRHCSCLGALMPFRCARGAYTGNEEPSLDELLAEPIVRLMTGPDRVKKADVRRLARVAERERLVWQSD